MTSVVKCTAKQMDLELYKAENMNWSNSFLLCLNQQVLIIIKRFNVYFLVYPRSPLFFLMEAKFRPGCWKEVRNTFARLSVNKHISSDTPSASPTSLTRTAVGHITAVDEAPGVLSRRETTPSDLWVWLAARSLGATCDPAYLHERRLFTFWTLCMFLGSVSSRCSCINHRRSAPEE